MATDWQAVEKAAGRIEKLAANLARFGDTQHAADLRLLLSALAEARENSGDEPDLGRIIAELRQPPLTNHAPDALRRAYVDGWHAALDAIDAARGGAE